MTKKEQIKRWVIFVGIFEFIALLWMYSWSETRWPVVGYSLGCFAAMIPAMVGLSAWIRSKNKW